MVGEEKGKVGVKNGELVIRVRGGWLVAPLDGMPPETFRMLVEAVKKKAEEEEEAEPA